MPRYYMTINKISILPSFLYLVYIHRVNVLISPPKFPNVSNVCSIFTMFY